MRKESGTAVYIRKRPPSGPHYAQHSVDGPSDAHWKSRLPAAGLSQDALPGGIREGRRKRSLGRPGAPPHRTRPGEVTPDHDPSTRRHARARLFIEITGVVANSDASRECRARSNCAAGIWTGTERS